MLFRRRRTTPLEGAGGREGVDPAGFPGEAGLFVQVMGDLAPELRLDLSVGSAHALDAFIEARFGAGQPAPDSIQVGVGCYVGEVIRRAAGGSWTANGTLCGVGSVSETFPLAKSRARFEHGPTEHLGHYVDTVLRYAGPAVGGEA